MSARRVRDPVHAMATPATSVDARCSTFLGASRRLGWACIFALSIHMGGCGGEDGPPMASEGWTECTAERDLWERCDSGGVIWCHDVFGDPHFHAGAQCAQAGLECAEVTERKAVCTERGVTCEAGSFSCEDNIAVNCINGVRGLEPCGTRKRCLADDAAGVATCWDDRPNAPCSGHGDLYASGCVCHTGYVAGSEPDTCVPG